MSGSEGADSVHNGHHDESFYAILFLFVSLLVGAVSRHLLAKVPVPYTALLLVWTRSRSYLHCYLSNGNDPAMRVVVSHSQWDTALEMQILMLGIDTLPRRY